MIYRGFACYAKSFNINLAKEFYEKKPQSNFDFRSFALGI